MTWIALLQLAGPYFTFSERGGLLNPSSKLHLQIQEITLRNAQNVLVLKGWYHHAIETKRKKYKIVHPSPPTRTPSKNASKSDQLL